MASFVIGLVGVAGACGLMIGIMSIAYAAAQPFGAEPSEAAAMALGIGLLANIGVCIVGLVLGIIGACQSSRKKIFAILGIIFNALIILGFCGLFCLGVVAR